MARGVFWPTFTLWAALYAASFAMFWIVEPTGDSFTRGLNRIGWFLLLQLVATGVAIVLWGSASIFPSAPVCAGWHERRSPWRSFYCC